MRPSSRGFSHTFLRPDEASQNAVKPVGPSTLLRIHAMFLPKTLSHQGCKGHFFLTISASLNSFFIERMISSVFRSVRLPLLLISSNLTRKFFSDKTTFFKWLFLLEEQRTFVFTCQSRKSLHWKCFLRWAVALSLSWNSRLKQMCKDRKGMFQIEHSPHPRKVSCSKLFPDISPVFWGCWPDPHDSTSPTPVRQDRPEKPPKCSFLLQIYSHATWNSWKYVQTEPHKRLELNKFITRAFISVEATRLSKLVWFVPISIRCSSEHNGGHHIKWGQPCWQLPRQGVCELSIRALGGSLLFLYLC